MKPTNIVSALCIAGLALGFAYARRPLSAPSVSNPETYYLAATSERADTFGAIEQTFGRVVHNGGLASESAEFHYLQPIEDPAFGSPTLGADETGARRFWYTPVRYDVNLYYPELPMGAIPLGMTPVFPRVIGQYYSTETPVGSGQYSVMADFDQRAVDVLSALVGTTSSAITFQDWYDIWHTGGGISAEMRCTLVVENEAFRPFSVTDIVIAGVPASVELASGLDAAEAATIVEHLN